MGFDNDIEIGESDCIITQKQSSSSAYLNSEAFENQTSKNINTKMSTAKDNIMVNETTYYLPPSQITNPVPDLKSVLNSLMCQLEEYKKTHRQKYQHGQIIWLERKRTCTTEPLNIKMRLKRMHYLFTKIVMKRG